MMIRRSRRRLGQMKKGTRRRLRNIRRWRRRRRRRVRNTDKLVALVRYLLKSSIISNVFCKFPLTLMNLTFKSDLHLL